MSPQTSTVDTLRGHILQDAMEKLHADPSKLPDAYYSATVEPGFGMLVEPVNDDPFVFVLPCTIHRFESQPGSGTDKLRKRIEAGIFFRQLLDQRPTAQPAYTPVKGDRIRVALGEARISSVVTEVHKDGSFACVSESSGMRGDFGPDDFLRNGYTVTLLERPQPTVSRTRKP